MDFAFIHDIDVAVLQWFNGSDNLLLDSFMQIATMGITWIPFYIAIFYLVVKNNETMLQIIITVGGMLLCVLLAGGTDNIIVKPMVARLRPINDPMVRYTLDTISGVGSRDFSFFSAHAANTFTIAMFLCLLTRSVALSVTAFLWALLNAYTRLYLGMHYPIDVLVGMVWGCLSGVIGYRIYVYVYYKHSPKINYISSQYTAAGYSHNDIDAVITTFVGLLLLILVMSANLNY